MILTYTVKIGIPRGKVRRAVPISIKLAVKIMAALNPLASKNHKKGMTGIMYMIFPQFPNKANVDAVQCGHNTANNDVEIGPNEFQIIP